jgi:hypothetical protein
VDVGDALLDGGERLAPEGVHVAGLAATVAAAPRRAESSGIDSGCSGLTSENALAKR